ncbi:MAG: protein kinase family protein [Alphaproteobacteria bacterium]|nr:protein kinase family protein [Alphaproteobacteria bacterium]
MTYPLINDYKHAVVNPKGRFVSLDISPLRDSRNAPILLAGNFAGVFKVQDAKGQVLALKCFTRDIAQLTRRYQAVADFIRTAQSPYFLPMKFHPEEIFITSSTAPHRDYPVATMPWLEGRSLGAMTEALCAAKKRQALAGLTIAWSRLCQDLLKRGIAHGDLKHDNVFVSSTEGKLKLLDYDSMYLPKLKGLSSPVLGSVNFQHPLRNTKHFDETIDHFSMLVILLSLRALVFEPELFAQFHNGENLIFSREHFLTPESAALVARLAKSPDIFVRDWTQALVKASKSRAISVPGLAAMLKTATKLDATPAQSRHTGILSFFS